jgi:CDP-ribitol ribitolphosphotransferase
MKLHKFILNVCLHVVNLCTFWVKPKPDTVTFISLTNDKLTADFLLLDKELRRRGKYEIKYDLLIFRKTLQGDFLYFLNCLRQLVEIKKSAWVILNDNNYVISKMKPKHTKVLQVWHATGAVKQFGNQIKRQYPVANYDCVVSNSDAWRTAYAQAFGIEEDQVIACGSPRLDNLMNKERMAKRTARFFEKYPDLKGKRLILYAPTFRGNIVSGLHSVSFDGAKVLKHLSEDAVILYKFHPLLAESIQEDANNRNVSGEDLYTLMHISDVLVSDYSSVIFDYALLDKPMFAYVPDFEKYEKEIGLNIPYLDVFPGPIVQSEEALGKALEIQEDFSKERKTFQETYIPYKGNNTKRTADLLERQFV